MKVSNEWRFSIGRSPNCDIAIADESVSRRHARLIILESGLAFLVDCHSTRGTFLYRESEPAPFQQEFLFQTDIIMFGEFAIPAAELLKELRRKYSTLKIETISVPENKAPVAKNWDKGTRLARCGFCGTFTPKEEACYKCGQK